MKKVIFILSISLITLLWSCESEPEIKPISVTGVSLDTNNRTIVEGESFTLNATISPDDADNKTVTWASSDESVVLVGARGMVTAKSPGEAIVTVTTQDGGFTATCNITVNRKEVPVIGVALDVIDKTLFEGESFILSATILPENADNKSVTWASTDENIVKVGSEGKVTAVSKGEAIVSVTTQDGNKTATCTVKVEGEHVAVTGISLDQTTVSLTQGQSVSLIATVLPDDADNKRVAWTSSDNIIAEVDENGKVSAKSVGEVTITATTEEGNFTATSNVTVGKADVIELTTELNAGSYIYLRFRAAEGGAGDAWIDLNNNGVKDVGEDLPLANLNNSIHGYLLGSNTIKVYGKFDIFNCNNSKVTNLDVSNSSYLLTLSTKDNPSLNILDFSKNSDLRLIEIQNCDYNATDLNTMFETLLPKPAGTWRNIRVTGNQGVFEADLSIATEKGWEVTTE